MDKLVKLFEPGKIGTMELKNRIIMAPLGWPHTATKPGGYITDRYRTFFETMAKGGVGCIQTSISVLGDPWAFGPFQVPGALDITDDEHIPSAQRLVQAIHAAGAKATFQITNHGTVLSLILEKIPREKWPHGIRLVSPSPRPLYPGGLVPHPLTVAEIKSQVEAFGQAARRGKAAGFDAVRIQGGHHYLIHQFLSPRTNLRTDEYGGSLENRCRFACELTRRVREEVGPDYPLIIRMNGDDFLEGGITLDEAVQQALMFVEAGATAIDVSTGPAEAVHWECPGMFQPWAPLAPLAAAIKKATKVPVIVAARIDAVRGERILEEGQADFIQMGRALMADPELPNKAREGRLEDINHCIYCGHCQDHRFGAPSPDLVDCPVNPALMRDLEYKLEPAQKPKKVMVIGGGPGGMRAASTLAKRGHQTFLYEKNDRLGGQWNIVSSHFRHLHNLVTDLSREMNKAGVKVFLNREVSLETVEEMKPDAVVVATGAAPIIPDIPGIHGKNVVLAQDVLTSKVDMGQEVVIIGGGLAGLETALFLAEQGKRVSVVEMKKIAWDIDNHHKKLALMELLTKYGVYMYTDSTLDSVTEKGVNVFWDSGLPPTKEWVLFFLKADTVVLAVGSVSENKLAEKLSGVRSEVYTIGDCVQPRNVLAATQEGDEIGRRI